MFNEHNRDMGSAYGNLLANLRVDSQSPLRVEVLRDANSNFVETLGGEDFECLKNISLVPSEADNGDWDILSQINRANLHPWNPQKFDIHKLVRSFLLHQYWPRNYILVSNIVHNDPFFTSLYATDIVTSSSELGKIWDSDTPLEEMELEIEILKREERKIEVWPSGQPTTNAKGEFTFDYLRYLFTHTAGPKPLKYDPRSYLLIIPWSELSRVATSTLELPELLKDEKLGMAKSIEEWVLWGLPHPELSSVFCLYTEEEVYSSCVLQDYMFPNYLHEDRVVFGMTPISKTNFFETIDEYWKYWNDCALTRRESDDQLFLLQTVPGIIFRFRKNVQGRAAALTYFRNVLEAQTTGEGPHKEVIRELLGNDYSSLFENSLRVIPSSQFVRVKWDTPCKGGNGIVFEATWRKPVAQEGDQEQHVDAVIKRVLCPRQREDEVNALEKELKSTYTALAGSEVGCIDFLGITSFHADGSDAADVVERSSLASTPTDRMQTTYLVFERATQGPLLSFLAGYFGSSEFCAGWEMAVAALTSIASGLRNLHKRNVTHRDLHPDNVLVTDAFFPHEPPPFDHEYQFKIIDLGESRVLGTEDNIDTLAAGRASYGAAEYHAPEVHQNEGWTTKADIFALSTLSHKVFNCRLAECSSEPPDWVIKKATSQRSDSNSTIADLERIVPTKLMKIVQECRQADPDKRPNSLRVSRVLDNLLTEFGEDRDAVKNHENASVVEWTIWNWEQTSVICEAPQMQASSEESDEEPPPDDD